MANRPRRPRTGGRPETTIDGEAERLTGTAASDEARADEHASEPDDSPAGALVAGGASEPSVSGGEPDATGASEPSAELSRIDPADSDRVDGESGAAVTGAEASPEGGGADALGAGGEASPGGSAESAFAAEEGLRSDRRRDFGEFEDDDTVTAAAEPATAEGGADPLASSPYHPTANAHEHRAGPGFAPLAGAGLLGAAIALGAGAALLYSGLLPAPGREAAPGTPQQYASAGEMQQVSGDLASLTEAVEQLRSAQAAGGAGAGTVAPADFAALSDRVASTERAVQGADTARGEVSETADAAASAAEAAQRTASEAQTAANEARDTAGAARETAESASQTAEDARNAASSASQVAENAQGAAQEAEEAVTGFAGRLEAIEDANRQAAIALSAAALKAAIDRGTPFAPELERFTQASDSTDAADALRDFAAGGVPTAAALAARWPQTETAILGALRPAPAADAPVSEQVLSGLRSLVTVRPAAEAAGAGAAEGGDAGPGAAVARMDAAIARGDLGEWVSAWDTLPEEAKAASADFADEVRARIEADRIVDQSINGAIGATGTQG